MVEEDTIQSLVERAKAGETAAFGEIYDIYSSSVYGFLFARLRQKETAEDILQTTFYKAWKNLAGYRPNSNAKFSTWLFQIANYTLIDHWRTRKETAELSKIDNLVAFAENPELYEEYEYLWEAMKKLQPDHQTVLELRFRQDLGVAETAHIMNKTEIGIRVMQHRALKELREILENN